MSLAPDVVDALWQVAARLEGADVSWALTGSVAHVLQGVPLDATHDIDVQTDATGAYEIERRLTEYVTRPVAFSSTELIRSHYGELRIGAVKVELMGAVQKRLPDGSWEPEVRVQDHRRLVELGGRAIPVMDLAYEIAAYVALGRPERAALLRGVRLEPTRDP